MLDMMCFRVLGCCGLVLLSCWWLGLFVFPFDWFGVCGFLLLCSVDCSLFVQFGFLGGCLFCWASINSVVYYAWTCVVFVVLVYVLRFVALLFSFLEVIVACCLGYGLWWCVALVLLVVCLWAGCLLGFALGVLLVVV